MGYGAEGGAGGRGSAGSFAKGGWAGPDPVAGDLVPNPGGGTEAFGSPDSSGSSGSGEDHWRNQPRVPAGNPDGGQWTSEGGGGGDAAGDRNAGAARSDASPMAGWITLDWAEADGVSGEIVKAPDGTVIRRETDPGGALGWTERNVVTLPGRDPIQFLTSGDTQVVASMDGQEISRTSWTRAGPEALPMVQSAFAISAVPIVALAVDGAVALLGWMSLRDTADQRAVASFRAFESDATGLVPEGVVRVDRDTVEQACPRLGEVQGRLNDAADRVGKNQSGLSRSQYGTAVHLDLANQIRRLDDPKFVAEKSYFKTSKDFARYGSGGSVRVDVLEEVSESTVCVYDIKTGDEVIRPGRAREIARAVKTNFVTASRIILTEVRPGH